MPISSAAPLQNSITLQSAKNKPENKTDSQALSRSRGNSESAMNKNSHGGNDDSQKSNDIVRIDGNAGISTSNNNSSSVGKQEVGVRNRRNSIINTNINSRDISINDNDNNSKHANPIRSDNSIYQSDSNRNNNIAVNRKQSTSNQDESSNNIQDNANPISTNNVDNSVINSNHHSNVNVNSVSNSSTITHDKRRSIKSLSTSKKSKKNRTAQQLTTKDLGRWKPIDDLSLVVGIQQTNDLRIVHRGVKFSCKFTIQEMQNRWYSLLYDEPISRIAVAAMRNLHPELVASVHSRALFTTQEEELLATIKSVSIF